MRIIILFVLSLLLTPFIFSCFKKTPPPPVVVSVPPLPAPSKDVVYEYMEAKCAHFRWFPICLEDVNKNRINVQGKKKTVEDILAQGWEIFSINIRPTPPRTELFIHPNAAKTHERRTYYGKTIDLYADTFGDWWILFRRPSPILEQ